MDEKEELVISKRNKRKLTQCNDSKEDNTIKYIVEDKEDDSYMKSSFDFISNLKTSMKYFKHSNDIKNLNENDSIDKMKKEIKFLREKHIILKNRLNELNKHKNDSDIQLLENALNIIEKENISLKAKIRICDSKDENPLKNIKHIATVEISRMKSILSHMNTRPKGRMRSPSSTININTNKLLSDSNRLSLSCKNVNNSKYYIPLSSPSDSEQVLFSCRMKRTNDSLNKMMRNINSMSVNGKKVYNKNISKLKFCLIKNRQNVTSSTCSTLRKSVI